MVAVAFVPVEIVVVADFVVSLSGVSLSFRVVV